MQIQEVAKKLEKAAGLTEKQARVYVAALFLGSAPVQLIAEQAGINRATAYVILDQLSEIGLVSQSNQKSKTVFNAENIEVLEQWLEKQENFLRERRKALASVTPEIKNMQKGKAPEAPIVRFYKGEEGIRAITSYLQRKSKSKSEIYVMVNIDEALKLLPNLLAESPKGRAKKKLFSKIFYSSKDQTLASGKSYRRETKKLNSAVPADLTLYEDAVALSTYRGKNSMGIIIENKEIADTLRKLFELAWSGYKVNKN